MSLEYQLEAISRHLAAVDGRLADHHRHLLEIMKTQERIMTLLAEQAGRIKGYLDRQNTAIAAVHADVLKLKDDIAKLQNNPGPISPEDQQLLDGIEAQTKALAEKTEALDAETPPEVPAA